MHAARHIEDPNLWWRPGAGWQAEGAAVASFARAQELTAALALLGHPAQVAKAPKGFEPWTGSTGEFVQDKQPDEEPEQGPVIVGNLDDPDDDLAVELEPGWDGDGSPWKENQGGEKVHRRTGTPAYLFPDRETGEAPAIEYARVGCLAWFFLWLPDTLFRWMFGKEVERRNRNGDG